MTIMVKGAAIVIAVMAGALRQVRQISPST